MKAKTYQIAKDKLKGLVNACCSEQCTVCESFLFNNTDFGGGEYDGLDYKAFYVDDIHRIYKPVYMSTDKIGEWLTEWGYAYREVDPVFLIQFKGKIMTNEEAIEIVNHPDLRLTP